MPQAVAASCRAPRSPAKETPVTLIAAVIPERKPFIAEWLVHTLFERIGFPPFLERHMHTLAHPATEKLIARKFLLLSLICLLAARGLGTVFACAAAVVRIFYPAFDVHPALSWAPLTLVAAQLGYFGFCRYLTEGKTSWPVSVLYSCKLQLQATFECLLVMAWIPLGIGGILHRCKHEGRSVHGPLDTSDRCDGALWDAGCGAVPRSAHPGDH